MKVNNPKQINEKKIIKKIKGGNKKAFKPLVEYYMKKAYYIALGFVQNEQDALDISQNAFVKAYKNIKSFDESRKFFPWFYKIIRNLCFDYLNKNKKKNKIYNTAKNLYIHNTKTNSSNKFSELLIEEINKLPPEQKEIIILKYFEDYTYNEIAETTNKPIGTIMSSLYYIKQKLKKQMEVCL